MTSWSLSVPDLELPRDAVHVWRTRTEVSAPRLAPLAALLAPDERARAGRFLYEEDRRQYTVARGVLRSILARYLEVEPAAIEFRYGAHGKPSLAESPGGRDVRFNLSHSYGWALHAFAVGREVGVDVERIRPETDIMGVARHSFSPVEVEALTSLPEGQRREAFFNCWTRKEAFIKAHGEGIALGLSRFDVTLRPGEPAALLRFEGEPAEAARWSMRALDAGEGYKAALAVEGEEWHLRCWEYPDDGLP
ncbi:MAG: 4'-phosphopantetheinyl transferase superfamily protein [Deltaproteobacteria bacterium]|nr:4'-phosphopantetheinyl transferase superfamily protein [Deltaproteobacteria bacterium]